MTPVDIAVVIADDAVERLASDIEGAALVVADANTHEAAGARLIDELRAAGVEAEVLVFPQRSGLRADLESVEQVRQRLGSGRLPLAVGAGVITDVVRFAAHQLDREFISVPTAASMDGYASSMAALQLNGVKVTFPARTPRAIYADPRVAAAAPLDLTRSGLGDLLGKASARVDWLAAHLLYGEPYSRKAAELVLEPLAFAASGVEAVLAGDRAAIRGLLIGLVRSGIAMAVAGSSRPASGCEHHASHFWDLLAARGMRPHHPHGLQVGYATRFALALQRLAFGGDVDVLRVPVTRDEPLGPAAREWLGDPSPEILAAVRDKQRYVADLRQWPSDPIGWIAVQRRLASAVQLFGEVERALALAGFPESPGFLDVDETMLRATFRYAGRLRARYTVLDFLEGQELLDRAIDDVLRGATSAPGRARESRGRRHP